MELFAVYNTYNIQLVRGDGCYVYDADGNEFLDLYGGHAVISVGHNHPVYTAALQRQMEQLSFYSNSVRLPIQKELATKLGKASNCPEYRLFLCNSGAEAVENALKLASFQTGRKKVIAFSGGFHGRTHGALAVTDNPAIRSPLNTDDHVIRLPFNDPDSLNEAFDKQGSEIAAVILECVQGVGGIRIAEPEFLQLVESSCRDHGAMFIADEVQSGFGRTGKFFSFQHSGVKPHLISTAKGMGNGFPIGAVLIDESIRAGAGMLGTTFGGNPLACSAALAVLRIMKEEKLLKNSARMGEYFMKKLKKLPGVIEVRGMGLMIGVEFDRPVAGLRRSLLMDHHVFTGSSKMASVLRFLPPLNITGKQLDKALESLHSALNDH
jgi:acetylornithine aminotransferase